VPFLKVFVYESKVSVYESKVSVFEGEVEFLLNFYDSDVPFKLMRVRVRLGFL
jgi:hypothetical protein